MKLASWIICLVGIWIGLTATRAAAQAEVGVNIDQPIQEIFQTGLVYPQDKGEVQLTYTSRFSTGSGEKLWRSQVAVEYGITDRWQVEFEWEARRSRTLIGAPPASGPADLAIGTQYSFMKIRGSNVHSAIGLEVSLPVGSVEDDLNEGLVEVEPYFIIAKDFPRLKNLQLFSQVSVALVHRTKQPGEEIVEEPVAHEFNLGLGMFLPFRDLVITGEFNFSSNRWNHRGQEREMFVTPGIVWRLPRNWEIGIGAPQGLSQGSAKHGLVVKIVAEFNLWSDR